MSPEENKAVLRRVAEAIGRGGFDAFDELMAPALAQEFKQDVAEVRRTFPEYHGTKEIQVAEGDIVASRSEGRRRRMYDISTDVARYDGKFGTLTG
jgi:hypothetical protein